MADRLNLRQSAIFLKSVRCIMANICIADDEEDIVQLVRRFTEYEGYQVWTVSNGFDGSAYVSATRL